MAWIREGDVLKRVEASGSEPEVVGFVRNKNEVRVTGENDAAVRFLHDLEKLINEYFIDGSFTGLGEDRLEEHGVHFLDEDLASFVPSLGNVDSRIYLEVTTVFGIGSAKRNGPSRVEETFRGLVDRRQIVVSDAQAKACPEADIQHTHDRNGLTSKDGGPGNE